MPSATFHHEITIDAPQDQVWDGLQDPAVWNSIGPVQNLWDPVVQDGVLTGFQWSTDIGGVVYKGTGESVIQERPDRYQLILDTSEIAGTISVDLSPADPETTTVDVTVELRSKGLLSSIFFPVVSRAIGEGLPGQVEDMAAQLGA